MWHKNKKNTTPSTALMLSCRKDGGVPSVINKDTSMLGNIISEGVIDFDGTLDGNIRCTMLTIRANGTVKGEVAADYIAVHGKVDGLIRARVIHLHAGCHVEGIIMHESLTIDDGAFFDGKIKRTDRVQQDESDDSGDSDAASAKLLKNIRLIQ